MKNVKCFFQLMDLRDGTRTDAVGCSRVDFADALRSIEPEDSFHFRVLVLVDDVAVNSEWQFSRCPLMTVASFVKEFGSSSSDNVEVSHG